MFTVKLGEKENRSFTAQIVEETTVSSGEIKGEPALIMQVYTDDPKQTLKQYRDLFEGEFLPIRAYSSSGKLLGEYDEYTANPLITRRLQDESSVFGGNILFSIKCFKEVAAK